MAAKICVVSLSNSSQALMLTTVFRCIKHRDKDAHVTLIINKKDKDLERFIDNVDDFILFDKDATSERLLGGNYTLIENHEYIKGQLKKIINDPLDLVINGDCDNISAVVTSMLNTRAIEGATFDEYGRKWVENQWLSYFNNVCEDNRYNLFHYTDIISAGCETFKTSKDVVAESSDYKRVVIALYTHDLGKEISHELGKRIETTYKDYAVVVLDSEPNIKELAELIKSSSIFITSDYLSSTLASLFNKKVVLLVKDDDYILTGPYGDGNWIIKPKKNSANVNDDLFSFFGFAFCHLDKTSLIAPNLEILVSRHDRDGFLEYIPLFKANLNEGEFYKWIYRAVWKCTIGRNIKVGDPQRFLAFGEKYIDRVVDIDREVEYLAEKIFSKYHEENIKFLTRNFNEVLTSVIELKETAFEGQKKAREFLNTVAINSENLEEIKSKRREITAIDDEIYEMMDKKYLEPIVRTFRTQRDDTHIMNLFPLAKRIIGIYEELFSKSSFLEEIIKGLWKKIN